MAAPALAGNLDSYYLSGEAALQGGAITATTHHGGAIWYNPAGLASVDGGRLDASVSAYALHLGGQPDIDASSASARTTRLQTVDFRVVPAALSYVRRFGAVTLGVGVFVPSLQTMFLRTQIREGSLANTDSKSPAAEVAVDAYGRVQDYFVGPGLGWQLARNVKFGASLFAIYRNYLALADVDVVDRRAASPLVLQSHSTLDWQQFGFQPVLGLQLAPDPKWHLGFTVRLPSLRIYQVRQSVDTVAVATSTGADTANHQSNFADSSGFSIGQILPMRLHVGVSRAFRRSQLGLDLSYSEPLYVENLRIDWKPTINARLGGSVRVGDRGSFGGGLFTDRSPERRARSFGDTKIDYYGITACIDWGTLYSAFDLSDPKRLGSETFRFGTTVALSYAIGVGQGVSTSVDFASGSGISERTRSVTAHEITLQLASSLAQ